MYSLKHCDLFKRINKDYNINDIRLACVYLKNEAFIVDKNDDAFQIVSNSFRKLHTLCNKGVEQFVYCHSSVYGILGYHALVLCNDGQVYGWGRNNFYQVSEFSIPYLYEPRIRVFCEKKFLPIHKHLYYFYDDIANYYLPFMNTNTCFRLIFEPHYYFKIIASGQRHCVGLTKDNKIVVWGDNYLGQRGNGTFITTANSTIIHLDKPRPPKYETSCFDLFTFCGICCCLYCKCIAFQERNFIMHESVDNFYDINYQSSRDIKKITCATYHTFVLFKKGDLYGWGVNYNEQLGLTQAKKSVLRPTLLMQNIKQVVTSGLYTLALTFDKRLFSMGDNTYGQLGNKKVECVPFEIDLNFVRIATINGMSMARDETGNYFMWGFYGYMASDLEKMTKINGESEIDKATEENKNAEYCSKDTASASGCEETCSDKKQTANCNGCETNNEKDKCVKHSCEDKSNHESSRKITRKKKVSEKSKPIFQINKPEIVNCKSFAEIVARRFSITYYTIKTKTIDNTRNENTDSIQPLNDEDDDEIMDNLLGLDNYDFENLDLVDNSLLEKVEEDDDDNEVDEENLPEGVSERLDFHDKKISYLEGRIESAEKNKTVTKIHYGNKIKSSLFDRSYVIPNGAFNVKENNITGMT